MCYDYTVETEEYKGYTIKIKIDEDCPNPRTWADPMCTMIGFSRDYQAGDKHNYGNVGNLLHDLASTQITEAMPDIELLQKYYGLPEEYDDDDLDYSIDTFWEALNDGEENAVDFALTIASKHYLIEEYYLSFYRDGAHGYAYISDADIIKEYGDLSKDSIDRARKYMKGEIEEYENWGNGNCYGYVIEGEDGEDADDSCWGFIGDWDYCMEEAKSAVDYMAKKRDEALSAVREYGYA